jgi:hypothetical protein
MKQQLENIKRLLPQDLLVQIQLGCLLLLHWPIPLLV